jgi:hypothetical protein
VFYEEKSTLPKGRIYGYELPKKPIGLQKYIITNRYVVLIKNAPLKLVIAQLPNVLKYEIMLLCYMLVFHISFLFLGFNSLRHLKKRKELKQFWTKQSMSEIYKWILK